MIDSRAGKTFSISWEKWVEFCNEHDVDPWEDCEYGVDLGGGDSYTVMCYDITDEMLHLFETQMRLDKFRKERWQKHENLAYPFLPEIHNISPKREKRNE